MGNILSLWQDGQPAGKTAALIQEANDVNIQGSTVTVVDGNGNTVVINNTTIPIPTAGGAKSAIQIIRKKLNLAKFPTIQQDTYDNRTPETGLWFLQTPQFKEWWTGEGRVLWATGMPGAGKTHVAACAIHHALQKAKTNPRVAVSSGYFQYSDPKPTVKVLQSLVRQQAEYCPEGAELVAATIEEREIEGKELSQADCIDLLRYMSERCESWFFLDALDESSHDAQFSFLELCATIPAKVCIFSRPLMDMQHHLEETLGGCGLAFSTIVAQDQDIELLVNKKIDSTPGLRRLLATKEGLRERITRKVIENACGMFVHAALQIKVIRHMPTVGEIELKLDAIPKGIDAMYDETMKRIEEQPEGLAELGKKVLLWVGHSERQLTVKELQRALATDIDTETFDENYIAPEDRILAACCGLVNLTSKKEFRLTHMTALEAVRKHLLTWFPSPHSILAGVCMATLVSSGFASGGFFGNDGQDSPYLLRGLYSALSRVPLLEYAHRNFALHLRRGLHLDEHGLRQRGLAFFRQCTSFPLTILQTAGVINATPIHVAASCNIPDLLHSLIQQDQLDINLLSLPGADNQVTPLMVASAFGNVETVEYILTVPGVDPNCRDTYGQTPLHWAAVRGDKSVFSCLLNYGTVDQNIQDNDGWTALMVVIRYQHKSAALQLLRSPGIDLTVVSAEGRTPFSLALGLQFPMLAVEILDLEPGIDVNACPIGLHPPLAQASIAGYGEVVQRLLAHPRIRLVHPNVKLGSPLTLALTQKHLDIVRQFLAFPGVDAILNVPGKDAWTPLMYAAQEGDEDIVRRILAIGKQHGINLKSINKDGDSALTIALSSNRAAAARLLVEADLGVDCWQNPGIRSLFVQARFKEDRHIPGPIWIWVVRCVGQLQRWVQDGCPAEFELYKKP